MGPKVDIPAANILTTSRSKKICVGLSVDERTENLEKLPYCLDVLSAPGLSTDKTNKCQNKLRLFAPTEAARQYYMLDTVAQPG